MRRTGRPAGNSPCLARGAGFTVGPRPSRRAPPARGCLPRPVAQRRVSLLGVRAVPLPNSAEPGRKFRPPWYGRLSGAVEGCPSPPPPRPGPGLWADCISPRSGSLCPRSAGSVAITRGLVSSPILVLVSFRHLVPFTAARWGRSRRSEGWGHASGPLDWTVGLRGSREVSLAPAQLQLLCDGHSVTERDSLSSPLAHVASLVMEVGVRPEHCLLWRRACGEPLGTLPARRLPGGPRLSWLEPAQLRSCLSVLRPSFLALTAFLCRKSKNRRPQIETP